MTYETIDGTAPHPEGAHEPRTIEHTDPDGRFAMMSEIGDGIFVAWDTCYLCHRHVKRCGCPNGPTEPDHIDKWRTARFSADLIRRVPTPDRKPVGVDTESSGSRQHYIETGVYLPEGEAISVHDDPETEGTDTAPEHDEGFRPDHTPDSFLDKRDNRPTRNLEAFDDDF